MSVHYELRCRECGKTWGNAPRSFCEDCFSPLEVAYDYDALKKIARRENLAARNFNMWRYAELLPLPENYTGPNAVAAEYPLTEAIAPRLEAFEAYLDAQPVAVASSATA